MNAHGIETVISRIKTVLELDKNQGVYDVRLDKSLLMYIHGALTEAYEYRWHKFNKGEDAENPELEDRYYYLVSVEGYQTPLKAKWYSDMGGSFMVIGTDAPKGDFGTDVYFTFDKDNPIKAWMKMPSNYSEKGPNQMLMTRYSINDIVNMREQKEEFTVNQRELDSLYGIENDANLSAGMNIPEKKLPLDKSLVAFFEDIFNFYLDSAMRFKSSDDVHEDLYWMKKILEHLGVKVNKKVYDINHRILIDVENSKGLVVKNE